MSQPKIGAGHAEAMARLGLKEIRNAMNPAQGSVADSEIGLYGTQTQGEIAQARGGAGAGPEQEQENSLSSIFGPSQMPQNAQEKLASIFGSTELSKAQDAAPEPTPGMDQPQQSRGRGH